MNDRCMDCDNVAAFFVVGLVDDGNFDFKAANPYCDNHASRYSTRAPWAPDHDVFSFVFSITPVGDYRGD